MQLWCRGDGGPAARVPGSAGEDCRGVRSPGRFSRGPGARTWEGAMPEIVRRCCISLLRCTTHPPFSPLQRHSMTRPRPEAQAAANAASTPSCHRGARIDCGGGYNAFSRLSSRTQARAGHEEPRSCSNIGAGTPPHVRYAVLCSTAAGPCTHRISMRTRRNTDNRRHGLPSANVAGGPSRCRVTGNPEEVARGTRPDAPPGGTDEQSLDEPQLEKPLPPPGRDRHPGTR